MTRYLKGLLAPAILLAIVLSGCTPEDVQQHEVDMDTIMGRKVMTTTTLYPIPTMEQGALP